MGTLLDAFALIAFVDGERAAPDVRNLLRVGDCAISTINLAEAGQRLLCLGGVRPFELEQVVSSLPLAVLPLTERHAWSAAELRARYYERRTSAVSLADCCLVAVATKVDCIATADPAVLRMAETEGIGTVELPRS